MGTDWELFSHTYGVKIVTSPARSHYQLGLAERNSSLLITLFAARNRDSPTGWSKSEISALTSLSRNLHPSIKTGLYPLHLLAGRNDMAHRLLDDVQIYDDATKTWQGTYKLVFNSGRNCYLERGNKMGKQPTQRVRKLHPNGEPSYSNDGDVPETEKIDIPPWGESHQRQLMWLGRRWILYLRIGGRYHFRSQGHIPVTDNQFEDEFLRGCDNGIIQSIFATDLSDAPQ